MSQRGEIPLPWTQLLARQDLGSLEGEDDCCADL
jgi:hypothetical protein